MTATAVPTVAERSRPGLLSDLDRIRALLTAYADGRSATDDDVQRPTGPLGRLVARLGLSGFERDLLMLAAAVELDGEVAALVGEVQGTGDPRPTFALAMSALPGAHWDALTPARPLRRWALVDLGGPGPLATRPIRIDEHVLHVLTGLGDGDGLDGLVRATGDRTTLTPSQQATADELAAAVAAVTGRILLRLDGDDDDARLAVAARVADRLGGAVLLVRDAVLADTDLRRAALVLDREALIGDRLVVTGHERLLALLESPIVVAVGADDADVAGRTLLARRINHPPGREQVALWTSATERDRADVAGLEVAVRELGHHYRLSARSIDAIAGEWSALPDPAPDDLRRLTRERARVGLGSLADLIEPRASWADLVLPEGQQALLHDIARQVRHRSTVHDDWGFGDLSGSGLGVTALFAGESGTGKTMAAEVVAHELGLDLYRIDLSSVVSKYIGETEKNLRRLFDAAETAGAVLLFDEADALFGKRTEVKDSHDRYANLEVAYLLQRMEAYRGLAILTTNLRANVDRAFVRRLRFVVQFPFPDRVQRAEIWRRAFPSRTPTDGLDADALAGLQVSGGLIRSIALAAAFAAADAGTPVRPDHVLHAAEVEYAKAERTMSDTERGALGPARRSAR